jgi:cellulose biosynthesis protein BcsQ
MLLVPQIPTTLSVNTLDQLTGFLADLDGHQPDVLAFFSMTDQRKNLHREISAQLPAERSDFAVTAIPALSVIERMSVERAPVAAWAPRTVAARRYAELWKEALQRSGLKPARAGSRSSRR